MKRNFSSLFSRPASKGGATALAAILSVSAAYSRDLSWNGTGAADPWQLGGSAIWTHIQPNKAVPFVDADNVTFQLGTNLDTSIEVSGIVKPGTVNIGLGSAYSFSGGGSIQATGAITVDGALTLNAAATNTASLPLLSSSSTLTVNNSGSLILAGPGNNLGDATSISLSGGQIQISGSGSSETLGALTLSSSPSSLNFSGTGSSLTFASLTGSSGTILNVFNFDPADHLYLTSAPAAGVQIKFYSGSTATPGQEVSYSAEVVPEPSTIIAGIGLVGFLGWRERRRIGSLLKRNRDAGEFATA